MTTAGSITSGWMDGVGKGFLSEFINENENEALILVNTSFLALFYTYIAR